MYEEQNRPGLSREQKIGFILLLFFAIFALGLGFLQIRNTMYAPFSLTKNAPVVHKEDVNTAEALAYRDTDRDEISDFDEIFVYQTSAYLADTDSDGMTDKEEVTKGSNPLCPEGKTCGDLENPSAIPQSMQNNPASSTPDINSIDDLITASGGVAQIRESLLKAGMDKKTLDQVSDEDLINAVKQAAGTSSIFTNITSPGQ